MAAIDSEEVKRLALRIHKSQGLAQNTRQHRRNFALCRRKMFIPGAKRKPIRFTNCRHANLDRQIQIRTMRRITASCWASFSPK